MTEQQPYDILQRFPGFELRRYPAHLVAEVEVASSFTGAGTDAFRILAAFISGRNTTRTTVAMTAPVVQEEPSARIAMTSPVVQEAGAASGRHLVGFVMPAKFSLDTVPTPSDPRIRIREIPTQVAAASAFTGRWTERAYQRNLEELRSAVTSAGLQISGPPRFARFNPPWTPWFLRRNEVILPVAGDPASDGSR